jgi:FKBP-type peptidyl-prolyl cis-trans isomerase
MGKVKRAFAAVVVLGLLVSVGLFAADEEKAPGGEKAPEAKADMAKVSYCIGISIGRTMKEQEIALNVDNFMEGLRQGLAGKDSRITDEEMEKIMTAFQQEMVARRTERVKQQADENLKKGQDFLAGNKTKEGVKVLESGLQYKVLREGTGKQPKAEDTVTVHYRGTLLDGTEFDSSYKRNEPATFEVNGVIPGWTEALQLMKEGAKWQLFVPAALAYGERGVGQVIGPNSVLIFEVELITVK